MANEGNTLVALALGAGAGYAIWHFFGDRLLGRDDKPKAGASPPPPPSLPSTSTSTKPIATGRRCQLRLDAKGLTAENHATDVDGAIALCKAIGSTDADVTVTNDAPSAAFGSLITRLAGAGVRPTVTRA